MEAQEEGGALLKLESLGVLPIDEADDENWDNLRDAVVEEATAGKRGVDERGNDDGKAEKGAWETAAAAESAVKSGNAAADSLIRTATPGPFIAVADLVPIHRRRRSSIGNFGSSPKTPALYPIPARDGNTPSYSASAAQTPWPRATTGAEKKEAPVVMAVPKEQLLISDTINGDGEEINSPVAHEGGERLEKLSSPETIENYRPRGTFRESRRLCGFYFSSGDAGSDSKDTGLRCDWVATADASARAISKLRYKEALADAPSQGSRRSATAEKSRLSSKASVLTRTGGKASEARTLLVSYRFYEEQQKLEIDQSMQERIKKELLSSHNDTEHPSSSLRRSERISAELFIKLAMDRYSRSVREGEEFVEDMLRPMFSKRLQHRAFELLLNLGVHTSFLRSNSSTVFISLLQLLRKFLRLLLQEELPGTDKNSSAASEESWYAAMRVSLCYLGAFDVWKRPKVLPVEFLKEFANRFAGRSPSMEMILVPNLLLRAGFLDSSDSLKDAESESLDALTNGAIALPRQSLRGPMRPALKQTTSGPKVQSTTNEVSITTPLHGNHSKRSIVTKGSASRSSSGDELLPTPPSKPLRKGMTSNTGQEGHSADGRFWPRKTTRTKDQYSGSDDFIGSRGSTLETEEIRQVLSQDRGDGVRFRDKSDLSGSSRAHSRRGIIGDDRFGVSIFSRARRDSRNAIGREEVTNVNRLNESVNTLVSLGPSETGVNGPAASGKFKRTPVSSWLPNPEELFDEGMLERVGGERFLLNLLCRSRSIECAQSVFIMLVNLAISRTRRKKGLTRMHPELKWQISTIRKILSEQTRSLNVGHLFRYELESFKEWILRHIFFEPLIEMQDASASSRENCEVVRREQLLIVRAMNQKLDKEMFIQVLMELEEISSAAHKTEEFEEDLPWSGKIKGLERQFTQLYHEGHSAVGILQIFSKCIPSLLQDQATSVATDVVRMTEMLQQALFVQRINSCRPLETARSEAHSFLLGDRLVLRKNLEAIAMDVLTTLLKELSSSETLALRPSDPQEDYRSELRQTLVELVGMQRITELFRYCDDPDACVAERACRLLANSQGGIPLNSRRNAVLQLVRSTRVESAYELHPFLLLRYYRSLSTTRDDSCDSSRDGLASARNFTSAATFHGDARNFNSVATFQGDGDSE